MQLAGTSPVHLACVAELLENEAQVDFVDINMGCPLDLICHKGMGSSLMGRASRVKLFCTSMTDILTCPLTLKMRVGIDSGKPLAHNLIPRIRSWQRVAAVGVHGRYRSQRYTGVADWDYVSACVEAGRAEQDGLPPLPIIGNGDIMSYTEWNHHLECAGVTTGMIARGALIKVRPARVWRVAWCVVSNAPPSPGSQRRSRSSGTGTFRPGSGSTS